MKNFLRLNFQSNIAFRSKNRKYPFEFYEQNTMIKKIPGNYTETIPANGKLLLTTSQFHTKHS
jgi:hypothetical protein